MLEGIFRNFNSDFKRLTSILIAFIAFLFIEIAATIYMTRNFDIRFNSMPLDRLSFLFTVIIPLSFNYLIIILLINLFNRFYSIINLTKFSTSKQFDEQKLIHRISLMMKMLDKINDTVLSINRSYMMNILISFFNLTLVLIFAIFLMYDIFVHQLKIDDAIIAVGGCSYALCISIGCFIIISYSSTIEKLHFLIMNNFVDLHLRLWDSKIHRQVHLAMLQLTHFRKELSGGLYNFNWKCIFLILTSVFNYVIVMIQFDVMISK